MDERHIQKVKKEYEERLLSLPNVVGVGIGSKIQKGKAANKLCIKVYVQKKLSLSRLHKKEIIPKLIDGLETDVEEIGEVRAE